MEAESCINKNSSIIVNYCDFNCYWSWNDFKKKFLKIMLMELSPHIKVSTLIPQELQIMPTLKKKKCLQLIFKKKPFTSNKIEEYTSSSAYFLKMQMKC